MFAAYLASSSLYSIDETISNRPTYDSQSDIEVAAYWYTVKIKSFALFIFLQRNYCRFQEDLIDFKANPWNALDHPRFPRPTLRIQGCFSREPFNYSKTLTLSVAVPTINFKGWP